MKLIMLILGLIFIMGCDNGNNTEAGGIKDTNKYYDTGTMRKIYVVEIDGCEYFVSQNAYGNVYSHKGNCNNKFHKDNQK